jgi:oxygen-independent coproporphyrinogen-3 oxidase
VGQAQRVDDYINALETEAARYKGMQMDTVYLGGGTPTFLDERQIGRVVDIVRRNFKVDQAVEWTIEANPENLDRSKAEFLRSVGFNRMSIGMQTFDERYLKFLGRNHGRDLALEAYGHARQGGFKNINVDLMFGFPGQTSDELAADVRTLASLQSEHVSLYNLTIEEKSRFHAQQLKLDDQEHLARQYVLICDLLDGFGFDQYEVSNFSRAKYQSLHNTNYWNGSQYVGLGIGAHGFLNNRRYWNVTKLQDYLSRMKASQDAVEGFEDLTPETRLMERILFGLRKNEGIYIREIEEDIGIKLDEQRTSKIEEFIADGFLIRKKDRILTTMKGRLVLDELSSRLI